MSTEQADYLGYLSGWWAFAGSVMLIVGGFNLIEGIAALAQKEYFNCIRAALRQPQDSGAG